MHQNQGARHFEPYVGGHHEITAGFPPAVWETPGIDLGPGLKEWKVWFGGDCEGLECTQGAFCFCKKLWFGILMVA